MAQDRGGQVVVAGRFEVERELGRGAMGVVLRARDLSAGGRPVALKLLTAASGPGAEERRARFAREGAVMAALRHPGIVAVHAAGVAEDGTPYLACELVEGARSLAEAARGAPLRRRVEWVRDAARALGHAHARGVVHRDVKPDNLLVGADGSLRVADLGMARAEDLGRRLTHTGQLLGTPLYMAPEQLAGEQAAVGSAADVWALGATLYELLTGRVPFPADTLQELMTRVAAGRPPPPRALVPSLPADLEAVVLAALAPSRLARPGDGEALAAELDRWLAGERPRCAQAHAQGRRRAGAAVLAAGALVAVVAAGVAAAAPRVLARHRAELAAQALDALEEWDGAACAAGRRACAGGAHTLARFALGAGDGPAPTVAELLAAARRLAETAPALPADAAPRAQALARRLAAHERLARRRRAPAAAVADEDATAALVEARLLADEEGAAPGDVVAHLAAARRLAGGDGPPGAAALEQAVWATLLGRSRAVPVDALAEALGRTPGLGPAAADHARRRVLAALDAGLGAAAGASPDVAGVASLVALVAGAAPREAQAGLAEERAARLREARGRARRVARGLVDAADPGAATEALVAAVALPPRAPALEAALLDAVHAEATDGRAATPERRAAALVVDAHLRRAGALGVPFDPGAFALRLGVLLQAVGDQVPAGLEAELACAHARVERVGPEESRRATLAGAEALVSRRPWSAAAWYALAECEADVDPLVRFDRWRRATAAEVDDLATERRETALDRLASTAGSALAAGGAPARARREELVAAARDAADRLWRRGLRATYAVAGAAAGYVRARRHAEGLAGARAALDDVRAWAARVEGEVVGGALLGEALVRSADGIAGRDVLDRDAVDLGAAVAEEALAAWSGAPDRWRALALAHVARAARLRGDLAAARAAVDRGLPLAQWSETFALAALDLALAAGDAALGRELLAAVDGGAGRAEVDAALLAARRRALEALPGWRP